MICPRCLKEGHEENMEMESAICPLCEYEIDTDNFIDPAELLRLIRATMPYEIELYDYRLEVIVKYLSGDPKPLEKLAGEGSR